MSRTAELAEREAFLAELTALTRKYGLVINGCGCCGSPWLEPAEHQHALELPGPHYTCEVHGDDLRWQTRVSTQ